MNVIHKYSVSPGENLITMPQDAIALSVQEQHGSLCLWVEIDDQDQVWNTKWYEIIATGQPFNKGVDWKYICTAVTCGGSLIWHVYERDFANHT